jgi:hypothetical protein
MILNYIKRLMSWRTEGEDYVDITLQIQKQILKRRYAEGKQDKLYGNPPKFSRSVIRHINLTSQDTKNVILFKKEKLRKLN